MPKVIKPSNQYDICQVSVLTTFSARLILAASTVFLLPEFQKRRNDGDGSFGATAAGFILNSKRLEHIL